MSIPLTGVFPEFECRSISLSQRHKAYLLLWVLPADQARVCGEVALKVRETLFQLAN